MVKRLHLEAGGLIQFQLHHHHTSWGQATEPLSGLLHLLRREGDYSQVVVPGTLNPSTGETQAGRSMR